MQIYFRCANFMLQDKRERITEFRNKKKVYESNIFEFLQAKNNIIAKFQNQVLDDLAKNNQIKIREILFTFWISTI